MAKKDFIPADIPSREDYEEFMKSLDDNATRFPEDFTVKDLKIDKRRTITICDIQLPGKYLYCPVKLMIEKLPNAHPVKLWDEVGMFTIFFDGALDPKWFEKSNVVIVRLKRESKPKNWKMMS